MVIKQRAGRQTDTSVGVSLPYGDAHISPKRFCAPAPSSYSYASPSDRNDFSTKPPSRPLSPTFFSTGGYTSTPLKQSSGSMYSLSQPNVTATKSLTFSKFITFMFIVVACYFTYSAYRDLQFHKNELLRVKGEYDQLQYEMNQSDLKLTKANEMIENLEKKARLLDKRNIKLDGELKVVKLGPAGRDLDPRFGQEEVNQMMIKRQTAMKARIKTLQEQIQSISHREALQRFGPGPHRVLVTVEFDINDGFKKPESFVLEMAPLDMMPHSVHLFLQMAAHQLWDETVFLHTAQHVLQAAPTNLAGDDFRKRFEEAELSHLAFPEYNNQYPHKKYTVGFGGRPGGPEFYISTQDNSRFHGPGGQGHHDLHEEADPCFAKVIDGFDVVDKLHFLSKNINGADGISIADGEVLVTTIKSIRLLTEQESS